MKAPPPKAVLFDHDGVLVASEVVHEIAWQRLLGELNLPFDAREHHDLIGKTAPEVLAGLLDRLKPGWTQDQYPVLALSRKKDGYYRELMPSLLKTYPGVPEGLKFLRSLGIRLGVVSNARRFSLVEALANLKMDQYFELILSREEFLKPKPDPTGYLMALETLKLKPRECLAVEDSPSGILGGLKAGIPTVGVLTGFTEAELKAVYTPEYQAVPFRMEKSMDLFFKGFYPPDKACK